MVIPIFTGIFSSGLYLLMTYPLDYLTFEMYINLKNEEGRKYESILECGKSVYKKHSIFGFYDGFKCLFSAMVGETIFSEMTRHFYGGKVDTNEAWDLFFSAAGILKTAIQLLRGPLSFSFFSLFFLFARGARVNRKKMMCV